MELFRYKEKSLTCQLPHSSISWVIFKNKINKDCSTKTTYLFVEWEVIWQAPCSDPRKVALKARQNLPARQKTGRLWNGILLLVPSTNVAFSFTKTTKYQALNSSRLKSLNLTITFKSIIKINISFVARFYFVCARLSCSVEFLNHCNSMDIFGYSHNLFFYWA